MKASPTGLRLPRGPDNLFVLLQELIRRFSTPLFSILFGNYFKQLKKASLSQLLFWKKNNNRKTSNTYFTLTSVEVL